MLLKVNVKKKKSKCPHVICKMKDTITKTRQAEYCGVLLFDL